MPIYLDNNATTRPDPAVVEAMLPYLHEQYANPSSVHHFGQQARHAVESAREQIAALIGARPNQIVFTGSGTESNYLAMLGLLQARPDRRQIITTRVEHDCVLRLSERLAEEGYEVAWIEVDSEGRLDPAAVEAAITDRTALISIMHGNNETGAIHPIEQIAKLAAARGVPLHSDAVQTLGKLPIDVARLGASTLAAAAHKFHGPKGVGFLYIRRGVHLRPMLVGGHQERDLRAGTENVAGIVGMAVALKLAIDHLDDEHTRVRALRDRLESAILAHLPTARVLAAGAQRLPNTAMIAFPGLEAEAILMLLSNEGLCASAGSACSSGSLEPSHVVRAMGIDDHTGHGAVRFSLSRFTTEADIDRAIELIPAAIARLSGLHV